MNKLNRLLLPLVLGAITLSAQVATSPVGYITLTINGSTDGTTPAFTALSAGLQNAATVTGSATSDATSAVLTDTNASNAINAYSTLDALGNGAYFLQITSGVNEGLILDILSNDATSFTTGSDLNGIITTGDTYAVKAHLTLADIMGASNEAGLKTSGSSSDSDIIFLMSSIGDGLFSAYYYQTDSFGFFGGTGWRSITDANTPVGNLVIGPDDGIIVSRKGIGDLTTVVSGSVSTVDLNRELPTGFSMISYPFPIDVTLAESGLYSATNGYVSTGSSIDSDNVFVIQPNGQFNSFYRQTDAFGFFGGDGWRTITDPNTPQDDFKILAGSSVIVLHRGTGLAWSDPFPINLNN